MAQPRGAILAARARQHRRLLHGTIAGRNGADGPLMPPAATRAWHGARTLDAIIRRHLPTLRKPGALTVRPGYEIRRHRLTGAAAIVVTVDRKSSGVPAAQRLPDHLERVPVDVRQATPHERLRARDPAAAALVRSMRRAEPQSPDWPLERELPSGRLLSSAASHHQRRIAAQAERLPATAAAVAAADKKPQIPYVPAPHAPLLPVVQSTTLTACVSPDAGFDTLKAFLTGCTSSLLVGMYDFTSGSVLDLFDAILTQPKTLRMVLDDPAPNATRDQTDDQTVTALESTLGGRARIVRALTRPDPYAAAWMFPSAYHIKAIVRDGTHLWLSSGNLNNSNLPDPHAPTPSVEDRDWHVVIENPALAALFAAYLEQDYASASAQQSPPDPALRAALADADAKLAALGEVPSMSAKTKVPATPRAAQTFGPAVVRITPLLTPDTLASRQGQYLTTMQALISAAKQRLYVQLQYIESAAATTPYGALLEAIAGRIAAGLDVRLIESLEYGESWAEKMKTMGVDLTARIRLQPHVHNKGFVIDSSIVVVSSQNFSGEGVQSNRDAGVIIESAPIAGYFESVFLDDWNNRAKPFAPP